MKSSKKIGIVTYYRNMNYGSVLQAFALQEFLRKKGFSPEIIDYMNYSCLYNLNIKLKTYFNKICTMLVHPQIVVDAIHAKKKSTMALGNRAPEIEIIFHQFVAAKLNLSSDNYIKNQKNYRAFLCGSDQVWNLSSPGLDRLFFLVPFHFTKRIAYAPSFATSSIPKYNRKRLQHYLKGMDAISVREETGKKIVSDLLNIEVPVVLDPVLLQGSDFWKKQTKAMEHKDTTRYILCYFLDACDNSFQTVRALSEKLGIKLLWIDSGAVWNDLQVERIVASPLEFVELIENAEIVCADSFHAMAFSTMLHTKFIIFERNYGIKTGQQNRIDSFLKMVDLEQRKYHEKEKLDFYLEEIDFIKSDAILAKIRIKSEQYLLENI